jgi:hypothetical protein
MFYIRVLRWESAMEANRMAATPEAPLTLMIMMLRQYEEWIRENLPVQQIPDGQARPRTDPQADPRWDPTLIARPPERIAGPPERRRIPEPVGERHNRRIPQDVKIAVSARDEGQCRQCGSTQNLHFDHIIPVSKGGANTVANIQLLCGPCNRAKAAR